MKTQIRKLVFYSLLVIFIPFKTFAQQHFKAGLKAGISTSQVAGDTYAGYDKVGFDGGAFVSAKFNEKWTGQFEIFYIQKGSKHNANVEKGDYTSYYLGLNYIEVPVLFQYHQKKYTFELGPGYSHLIKEKEIINEQDITGFRPFYKSEINFNFGMSYSINENLGVNCRFSNSITAIRKHASGASTWYNPGQVNNVLAFTLTYQLAGGKTE